VDAIVGQLSSFTDTMPVDKEKIHKPSGSTYKQRNTSPSISV
jgi:hypothetical protein